MTKTFALSRNSSPNIRELFFRIANHDIAAFEELFHLHYDAMYSTAFNYCKVRELAEDITQQVFLKVWERREHLRDVENPLAWLHTAARYQVLNALDREILKDRYLREIREHFKSGSESPDDIIIKHQQNELYLTALGSLSPRQLQVYKLSREQGMTYEKIGEHLGIGRETVKDYMATALRALRSFLRKHRSQYYLVLLIAHLLK